MMRRLVFAAAAVCVAAVTVVLPGAQPAAAAPSQDLCSVKQWQDPSQFDLCASRLGTAVTQQTECLQPPVPDSPDAGIAGWFTRRPDSDLHSGVSGQYSHYGVAGYQVQTYDVGGATGCVSMLAHPDAVGENAVASMEFTAAASIIGAANGLRERAYDPGSMWNWSDEFVTTATQDGYKYVFSTFGVLTLVLAGLYLISRARRGRLSDATQVAGWAMVVMVAVTAVAQYPLAAAHLADQVSLTGLSAMHSVLAPQPVSIPTDQCPLPGPDSCVDHRSVAVRASDTVTQAVLYRSWLRAELGSADSPTAQKYGLALYDAATLSWGQAADLAAHPDQRTEVINHKKVRWMTIAAQIKTEDPGAYEHLQGLRGIDRIGDGFVAALSAAIFAGFDMAASLLILLGFMVFRIAVIVLPGLATVGLLRPASGGVRRLLNIVVGSIINIVLFGAGAGVYLTATNLLFASDLPGAVQIFGVLLAGVAAFMLLRPVRRLLHTVGRHHRDDDEDQPQVKASAAITATTLPAGHQPLAITAAPAHPARPETIAGAGRRL